MNREKMGERRQLTVVSRAQTTPVGVVWVCETKLTVEGPQRTGVSEGVWGEGEQEARSSEVRGQVV